MNRHTAAMAPRTTSAKTDASQSRVAIRFPRSLSFRLALLYGLIFAASSALLIGITEITTIASLTEQRNEAISAELRELVLELNNENGIDEVKQEIGERDSAPNKSQFVYSLSDKDGHFVAGTRLNVPRRDGWADVGSPTGDADDQVHIVHFRSTLLPGGYALAIGEDTDQVDDLREFLSAAFVVGLGAAAALALAGGFALSWTFRRRLDRVAAVCREIMTGDLTRRIPARNAGDEIDLLATSVNSMLDRIVGLMDTLRQVSVDIAHDLGTPLTRMRQALETTEQNAKTTEDYSAALRKTIGQVDSILETFAALLRIAELEAGALRSAFRPVDLSRVMQTVADAYTPPAEESGQRLISEIESGVEVSGDESLLTQMFANLIANALRHTPQGTTVSVTLRRQGRRVAAAVSDDGPGIPEADRMRVLQRFVRLERSRSTPGSGLGLSVCAAIAELHGARLALADNQPGLRCELTF